MNNDSQAAFDVPEEIVVSREGHVRIVTLNRPNQLNAIVPALHDGLMRLWRQLAEDTGARSVVLTGAGRAFSAGGDLDTLQIQIDDANARRSSIRQAGELVHEIISCPLPIVAAVNGPAVGLGATIATCCDIVYLADTAFLSDPHIPIGLVAGDGAVASWPLAAGLLRAKEYILTGDRISADEAYRIGLANRVFPAGELLPAALATAHRLADLPPFALQQTKLALNRHLATAVDNTLPFALAAQSESFTTPEAAAALAALRNKSEARAK